MGTIFETTECSEITTVCSKRNRPFFMASGVNREHAGLTTKAVEIEAKSFVIKDLTRKPS